MSQARIKDQCIFFSWVVIIGAAFTYLPSHAGEEQPDYIQEISKAINPVYDGYVARVFVRGSKIIYGYSARRFNLGEVRIMDLKGKDRKYRSLISLGSESFMNKDYGVYSSYPRLVAVISNDQYIINLGCAADFPAVSKRSSGGVTGNVILYDAKQKRFTNLTKLDGRSGKSASALKWFPQNGILLLEESRYTTTYSDRWPDPKTARPECLKISDGKRYPIDDFPRINAWYKSHQSIRISRTEQRGEKEKHTVWTITKKGTDDTIVFETKKDHPTLRIFQIGEGYLCISHPELGTYLVDFAGVIRARISTDMAIDCNEDNSTLVLQSRTTDGNGQHRYWLMDLNQYFQYVRIGIHKQNGGLLKMRGR